MNIAETVKLWHRAYKYRYIDDRDEIRYLLDKVKKGDAVFDIGAHKGGYTFWLQKAVGKYGKVIAFEPQQKGAELLKKLFPQITVEPQAISSVAGEKTLYIQPQSYDVSFEASLRDQYSDGNREIVVATTIDDYCSMNSLEPSFIKIDVEGHELDVLNGGRRTLLSARPYLLVEAEKRHVGEDGLLELFAFLKECNYSGSFFFNGSLLPLSDFRASIHQHSGNITNCRFYSNNFMFEADR